MKTKVLYLFTRTPLHVGAGSSVGAIDQPVQRERHTGYPIIPGSSIKGVLADSDGFIEREDGRAKVDPKSKEALRTEQGIEYFGRGAKKTDDGVEKDQGQSGSISIGEAKLLAFPVRSAQGCFAWVTSSHLLKRWQQASGVNLPDLENLSGLRALFDQETLGESAVLEDFGFERVGNVPTDLIDKLKTLIADVLWQDLLPTHLAVVSDDMMAHFARNCCEVAQHVVIDDETGASKNGLLFNQENVPAETLFYSVISELRTQGVLDAFNVPGVLQLGGDATTGLGFCSTHLL